MDDKKRVIVKSNVLIESRYKLTAREQKIILYLISQIKPDDEDFKTYTLPIKKFSEMLGLKGYPKYSEIRKITKDLMGKVLEIKSENKLYQTHWLSMVVYHEEEGTVDLRFDPFLKPFLLQLKKEFTSYTLQNIVQLNGSYSIRLYELLKQYENIKERTFELDDLRNLLGVGRSYKAYGNFKNRILTPVQKELLEKTDISFRFEEIKSGRKIKKLKFIIYKQLKKSSEDSLFEEELSQRNYPLYDQINELTNKKGDSVNLKTVQRWERLSKKKWKDNAYNKLLFLVDEVIHKNDIENPIGYITAILKKIDCQKAIRKEIVPEWLKKEKQEGSLKEEKDSKENPLEAEEKRKFEELLNKFKD